MRQALLTSISHDLKTPLAAVLGAATTMRDLASHLSDAQRTELIGTIVEESERLNRFIANLLDMTKLESGAVVPNSAAHDLGELVGATLRRATSILAQHTVKLDLGHDLPLIEVDPVLFEQALFNLLDNAAKYAPAGSAIQLRAAQSGGQVELQVRDEGEGIPPAELETVFDKFYRVRKGDHIRPGTGLGLAIARGFIEAMGGRLSAGNRSDRSGAAMTIRLPIASRGDALISAA